jgi:2-C-methyl-D-erythritol 4-phosphate cytidylyltransferase
MNVAIIAAAGRGSRMGAAQAKQFVELAGVPIIIHTLRPFDECPAIDQLVVVLPAQDTARFLDLAGVHKLQRKLSRVVSGGETRAQSVWKGLQAVGLATAGIVAVHDGVRPCVTVDEISRTVRAAEDVGAAVLVAPVVDTIKEIDGERVVGTLPRSSLRRALTPQCFRYALLRRAYEEAGNLDVEVTDDSSLVERLGAHVATVEGHSRNIKITRPEDIALAETLLKQMSDVRC